MEYAYDPMEEEIYLVLAELFFLDTEKDMHDYQRVATQLLAAGWDASKTQTLLVQWIAPVAGSNLGWLFWPTIGEWQGFDQTDLCRKIQQHIGKRKRTAKWLLLLQDSYCQRMLKRLGLERLIDANSVLMKRNLS